MIELFNSAIAFLTNAIGGKEKHSPEPEKQKNRVPKALISNRGVIHWDSMKQADSVTLALGKGINGIALWYTVKSPFDDLIVKRLSFNPFAPEEPNWRLAFDVLEDQVHKLTTSQLSGLFTRLIWYAYKSCGRLIGKELNTAIARLRDIAESKAEDSEIEKVYESLKSSYLSVLYRVEKQAGMIGGELTSAEFKRDRTYWRKDFIVKNLESWYLKVLDRLTTPEAA